MLQDFHAAQMLNDMRMAEIERKCRSGAYIKYDDEVLKQAVSGRSAMWPWSARSLIAKLFRLQTKSRPTRSRNG